ncbi:MAG: VWA domain-containing protein [Pseudomonadota bacterium]
MKNLFQSLVLFMVVLILSMVVQAVPVAAENSGKSILLILDCSGSMWGKVDGQPKIDLAKQVTRELMAEIPPRIQVGLMAYGHRKKGDCQDIELIGSPGTSVSDLDHAVTGLTARGKTPITGSLNRAGELLSSLGGETTLVLISDGLETCGGDPCQVAGTLKAGHGSLIVHVVGFDVSQAEAAQLRCIATNGGGRYFQAGNLLELKTALGDIKSSVVEEKPLPPAPEVAEAAVSSTSTSKTIRIAGPGTVRLKLASWARMPRSWTLVEAETGTEAASGNLDQLKARAGEYQIVWRQSEHGHQPVLLSEAVRVKSGQTVDAAIDTGIRITVPKGLKAPRSWYLTEPDTGEKAMVVFGAVDAQVAPSGDFDLWWHQDEHQTAPVNTGRITLASSQLTDVVLDYGVSLQPADWLKGIYLYTLVDEKGNSLVFRWNAVGPQIVLPGRYRLVIRPSEHGNNDLDWGEVVVPPHGFAQVPINSGARFLHQEKAEPPYAIIFVNLDNKGEYMARQTWDPLPLPPGRYRLDWWESEHGSQRQTLAEEIVVEPGSILEVEL